MLEKSFNALSATREQVEQNIIPILEKLSIRATVALAVRMAERHPSFATLHSEHILRKATAIMYAAAEGRFNPVIEICHANDIIKEEKRKNPSQVMDAVQFLLKANTIAHNLIDQMEFVDIEDIFPDQKQPSSKDIATFLDKTKKAVSIVLQTSAHDWRNMADAFNRDLSFIQKEHFDPKNKIGVQFNVKDVLGEIWDAKDCPESWKLVNQQLTILPYTPGASIQEIMDQDPDFIACYIGTKNSCVTADEAIELMQKTFTPSRGVRVQVYAPDMTHDERMKLVEEGAFVQIPETFGRAPEDVFDFIETMQIILRDSVLDNNEKWGNGTASAKKNEFVP